MARILRSTLLLAALLAGASVALSGCVVVPLDHGHRHYGHSWDHHGGGHWRGGHRY